jgi:hypothetical protein
MGRLYVIASYCSTTRMIILIARYYYENHINTHRISRINLIKDPRESINRQWKQNTDLNPGANRHGTVPYCERQRTLPVLRTESGKSNHHHIAMNAPSSCSLLVHDDPLCFANISFAFYYSQKPDLIHGLPDNILTLAAPVIAYWCLSLFLHALDISGWKWLEKYRIHDSEEVQARNLATRTEVVRTVILQQVIQTVLGLISLSDKSTHVVNHAQQLRRVASFLDSLASTTFGERISPNILVHAANFLYWWGVPFFGS